MAIKKYRPTTPSRRFMMGYDFSNITTNKPYKPLLEAQIRTGGRNHQGRITARFRTGGHKQYYRVIDFRGYDKLDIIAKVATIEYDPNRTCRIALLNYVDGEKRYVLAWRGLAVGDVVANGENAQLRDGNRKMLKDIPDGFTVFNIEVTPFTKGKMCRSAGTFATIQGRDLEKGFVILKLQSGEVRKMNEKCRATIGQVGNETHMNVVIGKAGRMRWKGHKPHILGKSMNPVDHPHGGGEGHTDIGLKGGPKAFNGRRVAPGIKTRAKNKWSDRFIVTKRTRN